MKTQKCTLFFTAILFACFPNISFAQLTLSDGPYALSVCDYESSLLPVPAYATLHFSDDDDGTDLIDMGFDFLFNGSAYSEIVIATNGYLTFTYSDFDYYPPYSTLPGGVDNSILLAQTDLWTAGSAFGQIASWTQGDAGERIFVANFSDVAHYFSTTPELTAQVQLFETTNEIKFVITSFTNNFDDDATMGLNFSGGDAQYIEGRNNEIWSTENECLLFSPETETTCDATFPPTGLSVSDVTSSSVILHWDVVPGADKYVVALWNTSDLAGARRKGVTDNSLEITGALEPATEYGFKVKLLCIDEEEISPFSEPYYFTTGLRIGQTIKNISLFPNPSDGNVTLQLNGYENKKTEIILFNSLGQEVYRNQIFITDEIMNLPLVLNVSKGMYRTQILTGNDIQVLQLVVE